MARTHRSQDEWLTLIEDYERSGQTQTAFCQSRGLNPTYFSLKRSKLARASAELPEVTATASFIRMTSPSFTGIKVRVGAVSLELPADFSLNTLCQLITALA